MNEEELFCKLYPEYSVNGKPLSPYFDLFESGYEQSEKHIAEHKCVCERCIHTDCPRVLSDYGKDRNGICDHFKDVFDENAELKEKQKRLGSSTKCWFSNSPCRSCDEHDERLRRLGLCYIDQLTKAKEIIKTFCGFCSVFNSTNGSFDNIIAEAEQFLKELGNDKEKRA